MSQDGDTRAVIHQALRALRGLAMDDLETLLNDPPRHVLPDTWHSEKYRAAIRRCLRDIVRAERHLE